MKLHPHPRTRVFEVGAALLLSCVSLALVSSVRAGEDLCATISCDDQNPCTDDACDPADGQCTYTNDDANACTDGDACTDDLCAAGACVGTPALACDDGNPCTDDTCDPANGQCVFTDDDANPCSDADACTSDTCVAGACIGTPAVACDDQNPCTDDTCDPLDGQCVYAADDGNSCSDGNFCTSDACVSGACVGTPAVPCDDQNPCTDDTCDPASGGCVFTNDDDNSCSESACTSQRCIHGSCVCSVPLSLWTNGSFPYGFELGGGMGVSWGDYDADGFVDIFSARSGLLWHNLAGTTWELAADLSSLIPPSERRYGSSFGDYDNDGLPDLAIAPRVPAWGDDRFHLLHALGSGAAFADVAGDPAIVDVQPYGNAETLCWADVDGDQNLDLFVPVYTPPLGPGNFFLHNLGPSGPAGAYRFEEASEAAGLDVPTGATRPEGAQFADVDFDGDVDLFSNGTLYQNLSTRHHPAFFPLTERSSGVALASSMDEGAMFFDYDLDGDQDLVVAYVQEGVRIWENQGDGTFFAAEPAIVDSPLSGLDLGMSAEDWDNDGDIDFTTREVFRRNLLIEEGTRHFSVESHSIPFDHIHSATPAWADWDRDGDLDCALGNWGDQGHLYENTLYTPATPAQQRRDVRVRVVRADPAAPRGLEVEYGATAEIVVLSGPDHYRRRKFVASSHGYLNQDEYALHFALPPRPVATGEDLHFELSVDFPSLPGEGLWRVDKHVNPALADIDLGTLVDREIRVERSGRVVLGGVAHDPLQLASPRLLITTQGLSLPGADPLPEPVPAPDPSWYTGLAFDTVRAQEPISVREIVLDGQLAAPSSCAEDVFNLALWDVTDAPFIVPGGALQEETSPRNRRSYFPAHILLEPGRAYRLVAHVTSYRATVLAGPRESGALTVQGGIFYASEPCLASGVAEASVDPAVVALALRFTSVSPGSCESESAASCDDANPCTDDACGPAGACVHTSNAAKCDDDNACTIGDRCAGGACSGAPLDCDDSNPCTSDSCVPAAGCQHLNNTASCNDGNVCTTQDVCSSGQCLGVAFLVCDDRNPCTDDACNPATGCIFTQDDTNPCDDGNLCTASDRCDGATCSGTPISCEDEDACTTDGCVASYGCTWTPFEVTGLSWSNKTLVLWNPRGPGATYDVASGSVAALATFGSGHLESCLAQDTHSVSALVPYSPASRTTLWYLVRARNEICGIGTYGFRYPRGSPPLERILSVCP